ncbi:MAG: DNA methyltransferase [Pyrinomonadaceae bacterium]
MSKTVQVERENTVVAERGQESNREFEVAKLETIDWNFTSAKTSYSTHGLHPYPAKYIPQIPHALIKELSREGEVVADIFCGSGTTLVEALLLERNAVGVDANPLACLISEAKTTRLGQGDFELLLSTSERALHLAGQISDPRDEPLFSSEAFVSTAYRPPDDAVSFWFDPFVVEELAESLSWCRALPTAASRNVALAAFSSIVVAVSKQDSDTRYVRREKKLKAGDVLRRFARSLSDAARRVDEFTSHVAPALSRRIFNTDLLSQPDIGTVDLVVCSPPYPNAYSYHLYHMTRMIWLGMDQPKFKREEIGSHRKYSRKGANGANVETFRGEMTTVFSWLRRHLRPDRYVCFVVGDSTLKGQTINNAELISEVAALQGFREVGRVERRMQDTKKAFNPVIGKIKHEQIMVMKNIGGVSG